MNPTGYRLRRHSDLQRQRGLAGVAARARKRQEMVQTALCVGVIEFSGRVFGGTHTVRCLSSDAYSDRYLMIEIDGMASKARSIRGVYRLLARRLAAGRT